jgi:hypothetical protein
MNRYAVPEWCWYLLIVAMGLFGLLTEAKLP